MLPGLGGARRDQGGDFVPSLLGVAEVAPEIQPQEDGQGDSVSTVKIVVVTGMMPTSIQDCVYTNVDEQSQYPAVVARMKTWAENKAAMMNGPVPMEVGEVQWEECNE